MATDELYFSILAPEEFHYRLGNLLSDTVQLLPKDTNVIAKGLEAGEDLMSDGEILLVVDDKGITLNMERIIRLAEARYYGINVVELSVVELEALLGAPCAQP